VTLRHQAKEKGLTDLVLAIAHHILLVAIVATLFTELAVVRAGISSSWVQRIGRVDGLFGAAAGLILVIGFLRVFIGVTPEAFYLKNPFFWTKIAAFAAVGILSIRPTIAFLSWNRQLRADPAFTPAVEEVGRVRRFIIWEAAIFVLIPTFAAVMARGYGLGAVN
jgi:putative membrane protein